MSMPMTASLTDLPTELLSLISCRDQNRIKVYPSQPSRMRSRKRMLSTAWVDVAILTYPIMILFYLSYFLPCSMWRASC